MHVWMRGPIEWVGITQSVENPKWKEDYLEEFSEGLNEGEVQILGQPPHVVVGLDCVAVLLATAWRRA